MIQFDDIVWGLADQGHDKGLFAAVAFTDGFTGECFSGEDFVTALTIEMYFPGTPLDLFDFDFKGLHLVQGLPVLHPVAPAEGIAAEFPGQTSLEYIARGEWSSGLILAAHDIPLWFRLIHNYYIIDSWAFVNYRATDWWPTFRSNLAGFNVAKVL